MISCDSLTDAGTVKKYTGQPARANSPVSALVDQHIVEGMSEGKIGHDILQAALDSS